MRMPYPLSPDAAATAEPSPRLPEADQCVGRVMSVAMEVPMTSVPVAPLLAAGQKPDEPPRSVELRLVVEEPSMVTQLCAVPDGRPRYDLAHTALRIGLLALEQARGRIDADVVAAEGGRMLERLGDLL